MVRNVGRLLLVVGVEGRLEENVLALGGGVGRIDQAHVLGAVLVGRRGGGTAVKVERKIGLALGLGVRFGDLFAHRLNLLPRASDKIAPLFEFSAVKARRVVAVLWEIVIVMMIVNG